MRTPPVLWLLAALTLSPAALGESKENADRLVECRAQVLELAGAFANDGFKIRDSRFEDDLAPNTPALIQVNLYAGNQYWFVAAATDASKKLRVSVYDEKGNPVKYEPYMDENKAAAGFAPAISGPYYVKVQEESGAPASFCLIYCYK